MKFPVIKTKAGQYTWLQVVCLVISGIAFWQNSMTVALVFLFIGTIFGVIAAISRVKEAQRTNPQAFVRRRRR